MGDIIVVGASAGGVEALTQLVGGLPRDLPASLFVVLHLPPNATSSLPEILDRRGPIPATTVVDGQPIHAGHIYVAPPAYHLQLEPDSIHLSRAARENGHRPAIDVLFRSAAAAFRSRVIGVVLSGTLDDGAVGLRAVKQSGGMAIVQSPEDALFSGMPTSALRHLDVDYCLPAADIGPLLGELAASTRHQLESAPEPPSTANPDGAGSANPAPSPFSCPECGGVLWEHTDENAARYRCRVGHAFSPDTLLAQQSEALESALWAALRALEEKASLSRRLQRRAIENRHTLLAERFGAQMREAEKRATLVRHALLDEVAAG